MSTTVDSNITFLRTMFHDYYSGCKIDLPDRFSRREFAFVLFSGKGMIRHLAFHKKQDVHQFLQERIPMHAYYSSAYYQLPDAPTMNDKKWMGAELIFDLDSDHLPNAEQLGYVGSLQAVKQEFRKLVHEFLLDDFGFKKKYLELYFSGGRGYHCHVKDPMIYDLDSNERREIVDYITGRDLQDSLIFYEQATTRKQYGMRTYASGKTLKMPTPDQPGWKGRISRGIIDIVDEIRNSENPENKLHEYGVSTKDAKNLVQELSKERVERIKDGYLDQSKTIRKFFLNSALRKTAVSLSAGETDEPVTCDVKRLIRLPSSLHGKTGFQVVGIDIDNLNDFNPLDDAVPLSEETVTVNVLNAVDIQLKGTLFQLHKGEHKVPGFLAVFLLGRKLAHIVNK